MPDVRQIPINNDLDIVAARVEGRNLAKEMGFDIIDQARIATAISELARNVVLYAHNGQVTLTRLEIGGKMGIEVLCEDRGQGIDDLDRVMGKGYQIQRGEGVGLAGTKRLMDEFEISTQLGKGTRVIVRKWLHRTRDMNADLPTQAWLGA